MISFADFCRNLRRKGHTLGEIVQITGRPKTSVYFHINNIEKTNKLLSKIRRIRISMIKNKGPKRGESLFGRHCIDFRKWTPAHINVCAHISFDGSIRDTGILYNNRSKILIKNFSKNMRYIYNYNPKIYETSDGVVRLAYHNVELAPFFKKKISELLSTIINMDRNLQKEFLNAFFDDEGSVDFRSTLHIRRVRGYQHNRKVLLLIKKLLMNFDITSKIDNRFHEIIITGKENLKRFAKEINFTPGLQINGKRSNSIWKRDLEKREILKMAINSYL